MEISELLKELKKAEEEAKRIVEEAKQEAKRIIFEAKREAEELLSEERIRSHVEQLLKERLLAVVEEAEKLKSVPSPEDVLSRIDKSIIQKIANKIVEEVLCLE